MDEILLSPEKISEFETYAVHEWNSWPIEKKRECPFKEYRDLVLCRAQVAKVCSDFLEPWLARIEESIRRNPTEWLAGERNALRETIRILRAGRRPTMAAR